MAVNIQLRGGTLAEWTSANPILAVREMVLETDTNKFKIGDGVTHYLSLPYGGIVGPTGTAGINGAFSWTSVEIDFGSTPQWTKTFTISVPGTTTSSRVAVIPSSKTATSRVGNDAEWDTLIFSAEGGTNQILITATAVPGPVVGSRTILYQIDG